MAPVTRPIPPARRLGLALPMLSLAFGTACSTGQTTGGGGDSGGGSGAPPTLDTPFDWTGVVGTGQSLSVGGLGTPINPAARVPHANLKLSLGGATVPPFDPALAALAMVPLVEPIRPDVPVYPQAYPGNIDGETPHTAMANQIASLVEEAASRDYVTVHSVVGESGQPMSVIRKGATEVVNGAMTMGRAYAATLFEVAAIARLAAAAGKSYGVGAVVLTHGESDSGSATYEADMVQLWSDYNADLPPLTGQSTAARIPMLVSQQNAVPVGAGTSASTIAQWKVGVDHPGDIICIGPKYQYSSYVQDGSGFVHLDATGYELLGEKLGQVYFERVVRGRDWQPLQPLEATRAGNVVSVRFHVPVPPLVLDGTFPSPHPNTPEWTMGRGFEVLAAGAPAIIDSVEIVGADTVKIGCRQNLASLSVTLGYALTADGAARTGGGTYRWGHLRDSDPFVGAMTQVPQPNWAVAFQMSVP
jgi:hypothetical protein